MDILEEITLNKEKEVAGRKAIYPVRLLEQALYFDSPTVSLCKYLQRRDLVGIIAEFKRRSPSKGALNEHADVERTSIGYMQAGASALSVLTDQEYFGGKNSDLETARKFNYCPILRKDFIVDEYQVIEAKAIGADAILLIANVLAKKTCQALADTAHSLGLEVFLEIRDKEELDHVDDRFDVVGINNRNLKDFTVDIARSFELGRLLPSSCVKVSESGINEAEDLLALKEEGFNGFLIGETFMRHGHPEIACANFIKHVKELERKRIIAG